ncbi:MAG: hypothetical protein ACRDT4_24845, partial [Micromonosporaceae bacterium]
MWPPQQLWSDSARPESGPGSEDGTAGRGHLADQFWRRNGTAAPGGPRPPERPEEHDQGNVVRLVGGRGSGHRRAAHPREPDRPPQLAAPVLVPEPATAPDRSEPEPPPGLGDLPTGEFPRWGTGLVPMIGPAPVDEPVSSPFLAPVEPAAPSPFQAPPVPAQSPVQGQPPAPVAAPRPVEA